MNTICFMCNGNKTSLYFKMADAFSRRGWDSLFVTTSLSDFQYLTLNGIAVDSILYFTRSDGRMSGTDGDDDSVLDCKLVELAKEDRMLKYDESNITIIQSYVRKLKQFLLRHEPNFITGEVTWAHEVATFRLAKMLNIPFIYPARTRIPDDRIIFFSDEYQQNIVTLSRLRGQGFVPNFKAPAYIRAAATSMKSKYSLRAALVRIREFISGVAFDYENIMYPCDFGTRFRVMSKRYWRSWMFSRLSWHKELPTGGFVLITLHKQPEASADVLGRYYNDQLQLVKNIHGIIPPHLNLVVKPHVLSDTDQPTDFYRMIRKMGVNIVLIDPQLPTRALLDSGALLATFSISSTIALESSLKGKRSFTMNKMFFANEICTKLDWETLRSTNSLEDLMAPDCGEPSVDDRLRYITENSVVAAIGDPTIFPEVLADDNILMLTETLLDAAGY